MFHKSLIKLIKQVPFNVSKAKTISVKISAEFDESTENLIFRTLAEAMRPKENAQLSYQPCLRTWALLVNLDIKSFLYHFMVMQTWASYIIPLNVRFFISTLRTIKGS